MPLYDFCCPDGHVTEMLTPRLTERIICPQCKTVTNYAWKQAPAPAIKVEGGTPKFYK